MVIKYNQFAAVHFNWVESMGWHNKTKIEALALTISEIGEAMNECRRDKPTNLFGDELADVILRLMDYLTWSNVDIDRLLLSCKKIEIATPDLKPLEYLAKISIKLNRLIHNEIKNESKYSSAATVIRMVESLALFYDINLELCIKTKIQINADRGNRGRLK